MNLQEFYTAYNLNKYEFASIAGVGVRTLIKYSQGKSIRESSKFRIEKAMRVCEKYGLIRPKFNYGLSFGSMWYKDEFQKELREYAENFKTLIEREP